MPPSSPPVRRPQKHGHNGIVFALPPLIAMLLLVGCSPSPPEPRTITVDPDAAFARVRAIVDLGPRVSGTDGADSAATFLQHASDTTGAKTELFEWTEDTDHGPKTFRNVYVHIPGFGSEFVVLGSHYDTKRLRERPTFVGANDSASSSGLLLELIATIMANPPWPGPPLLCAFFDGEEAVHRYTANDGLHGSRKLVSQLSSDGRLSSCKAMILLDMIGDRDLTITISPDNDRLLTQKLFSVAERQGVRKHFGFFLTGTILDDHTPFLKAGVPAIDIIDFSYGPNNSYWHTADDTLDKLAPKSLEIIGNVVLELLQEL